MSKLIKNEVVSMDWDADKWFSRKKEFIAAVHEYPTTTGGTILVIFQESAYVLLNDEDAPMNIGEIAGALKKALAEGEEVQDYYDGAYCEICSGGLNEATLGALCIGEEHWADIEARLQDLSGYYYEEFQDMN